MIAKYLRRSLLLGVPGFLLQFAGVLVMFTQDKTPIPVGGTRVMWGPSLIMFGLLFWTAGLAYYAMAKGQSSWWGLSGLLGLPGLQYATYLTGLSLMGFVVLVLLSDRYAGSPGSGGVG